MVFRCFIQMCIRDRVVKLIAKDTIEEKIMQLQSLKQDLSDSIIHNNEGIITSMSKEELMNLF